MTERKNGLTRREFVCQVGLGAAALAAASTALLRLARAATIKNGMGYRTLGRTGLSLRSRPGRRFDQPVRRQPDPGRVVSGDQPDRDQRQSRTGRDRHRPSGQVHGEP